MSEEISFVELATNKGSNTTIVVFRDKKTKLEEKNVPLSITH